MTSDQAQVMHGNASVRHPGQACVSEIVPPQMLMPELAHDVIPMGGIPRAKLMLAQLLR